MKLSQVRNVVDGILANHEFKIKFYDDWQPELDEALQSLPETDIFPHELFRMLMRMAEPKKRRIFLVTERGVPIALVGLRNRSGYWEPVTQWIVPGVLFPVKEDYIARVLTRVLPSLGLEIRVAWWRWETPPPQNGVIKGVHSNPTHRMRLSEDFENYWQKSKNFGKNIRVYRKRCKDFFLKVNLPGATEWTIRKAEAKWRPQGIIATPDLAERLLVTEYLEKKGLHYTLSLHDHDTPVAGAAFILHRHDVVGHTIFRDPNYNWHGAMTHLINLSFHWAREMGFEKIDIGGSFDYKEKWAPEDGEKWEFEICPGYIYLKKRTLRLLRRGWKKLSSGLKRAERNQAVKT
jgi:hypothetical protein